MKRFFSAIAAEYWLGLLTASALAYNLFTAFIIPQSQREDVPSLVLLAGVVLFILHLCFYTKVGSIVSAAATGAGVLFLVLQVLVKNRGQLSYADVVVLIPYLHTLITAGSCIAVFAAVKSRPGIVLLFLGGGGGCFYLAVMGFTVSLPAYFLFLFGAAVLFFRRSFLAPAKRFGGSREGAGRLTAIGACAAAAALIGSQLLFSSGFRFLPRSIDVPAMLHLIAPNSNFAQAGYDPNGGVNLGVPLKNDNTPVMEVKADAPFYIKGSTYLSYTGSSWTRDRSRVSLVGYSGYSPYSIGNDWIKQFCLFGYAYAADSPAFTRISPADTDGYLSYYKAAATDLRLNTLSVTMLTDMFTNFFLPVNYYGLKPTNFERNLPDSNDYVTARMPKGAAYEVSYPRLDMTSALVKSALQNDESSYPAILQYLEDYDGFPQKDQSIGASAAGQGMNVETAVYASYTNYIYQNYLNPGPTTARVKNLAQSLTKNCRSDYEKVEAVKKYLSAGFTYTLTPRQAPQGTDFVDFFLFQSKQGYCVHFATAAAVLLRSAGVPCRFVEGYVSPSSSLGGVYKVTNNQAHAWVEVYSKTLGFYNMEATPGFAYASMQPSGAAAQSGDPNEIDPDNQRDTGLPSGVSGVTSGGISTVSAPSTPGRRAGNNWLLPIVAVLAAALGIAGKLLSRRIRFRRIRALAPNERVKRLYRYQVKTLERLFGERKSAETAREYADSLHGRMDFKTLSFDEATDIYLKARYGGVTLSEDELERFLAFDRGFEQACRKKAGRLKYYAGYILS